jgi:hypothetical protein
MHGCANYFLAILRKNQSRETLLKRLPDKRDRIEQINQQLDVIDSDIEQIQEEHSQKVLSFSGWVRIRIKN